jgi:hypothetical protein
MAEAWNQITGFFNSNYAFTCTHVRAQFCTCKGTVSIKETCIVFDWISAIYLVINTMGWLFVKR